MQSSNKPIENWFALTGLLAGIFYLLHLILGQYSYPGYEWMRQAVSDLTADGAPSQALASAFSFLYGIFSCVAGITLCILVAGKFNRAFRVGIYCYAAMNFVSFIGYTLFPLSGSGFQGQFQDIMHLYLVTFGVVALSILALALIGIGGLREQGPRFIGIISFIALAIMFIGSICMGIVPKELFGLFERFSVFSVVLFTSVLGVFGYSISPK